MDRTAGASLTLEEVAERLGVHYMTVYRQVRTGRLPARQVGGRWLVRPADVGPTGARRAGRRPAPHPSRLAGRMVTGDRAGTWAVVESALTAGSPADVYTRLLAPALREIGDGWASGRLSIADEHRATCVALEVLGRLGPLFNRRGRRRRGPVLLAGAEGDPHSMPLTMVGDVLRSEGYEVVQLGADVPIATLVATVGRGTWRAVGISAASDRSAEPARRAVAALRAAGSATPLLLGGPAVRSAEEADGLGADGWAPDAASAVALVGRLGSSR